METISTTMAWIKIDRKNSHLEISGGGPWLATSIHDVDGPLREINLEGIKSCVINLNQASVFDITGAWVIERLIRILHLMNIKIDLRTENHNLKSILTQIENFKNIKDPDLSQPPQVMRWIQEIGIAAEKGLRDTYLIVEFLGHLSITLFRCLRYPSKIRFVSIVSILNRVGLNAVPIVGLISLLIGVVLIYQGSFQLKKFGAEIYTVDLLAVSLLREIGILLTAIMVAGRSGSAFAAQIGTMKLNQELDALQTFGLDPMEVLVVPRVIALVLAMPLLAFITDIIGLAGGAIMSSVALDISFDQYLNQLSQSFGPSSFWVGIIKAPVFGFIIAMVGCFEGMQVHGGSINVGKKTTKAVVESIFLVVVLDAIFSILFTKLDL
jgi:phospholipid/cholesterol/gamma-HCH transport system permease protein